MSSAKVSRRKELPDAERDPSPSRARRKRKAASSRSPEPEEERKRRDGRKDNEGGGKSKGYGKEDSEKRKNKENDRRGPWGNSRERYGNTYYDRDYYEDREYNRYDDRGGHREYRGGRYWDKDRDVYEHRRDGDRYEGRRGREGDSEGDGDRGRRGERDNRNRSRKEDGDDRKANDKVREGAPVEDGSKKRDGEDKVEPQQPAPAPAKKATDMLTSKTGGAYIPPAKLRMMQAQITDKSSVAYQRIAWEALKKSIHGHINKVNVGNLKTIVRDLLKENVVRGRGLLCRSIIQAQAASPTFTHVYAALVSVINSKFPNIGELLMKRIVLQFRRGFKRNDKSTCISAVTFIAHLVNQRVAHEIIALEILTLLVESPTDDSIEVAIAFLKECGMKLLELSNKGMLAIFEMLRNILHEGKLEKRVQYMIEVIFQIRKGNFQGHEAVIEELDLVEEEDQFTHIITLDEVKDGEEILNVFKFDAEYEANEEKYNTLKKEILDESSDESGSDSGSDEEDSNADSGDEEGDKEATIVDSTETNLVALRRAIYLTIHSSLDFEECAHKLMRMQLKPGQEIELCHMFLDCCAEQRTYEKFFGLLAQRFCQINKVYVPPFQQIFRDTYNTIHRLDTNKLRNVAKFFAHLLFTDAISWEVLSFIRLNEEDTTSSSRIFIKILFQELSEYMSLGKLNDRVKDPTMQTAFEGLFPRDNPKNTRFAINFFTSIGLGGLTDELREHLKVQPKAPLLPSLIENLSSSSSSSDSDSSSSESSSDSSSSDSSSSDSDDSAAKKKKKNKRKSTSSQSSSRRSKKTSSGGGGSGKKKKKKGSQQQQEEEEKGQQHKKKRKQKSSGR